MFDWIGDLIDSVVGAIQDGFEWIGEVLLGQIWNTMMQWLYETVYTAVADFFALMGNMGHRGSSGRHLLVRPLPPHHFLHPSDGYPHR